jgi:hypothetical protein
MKVQLDSPHQKGQMVVEAVLLMTVLFGITVAVSNFLQSSQTAKKLTSEPWERLAGMIECGSWQACQGTPGVHPSSRDRNLSLNTGE